MIKENNIVLKPHKGRKLNRKSEFNIFLGHTLTQPQNDPTIHNFCIHTEIVAPAPIQAQKNEFAENIFSEQFQIKKNLLNRLYKLTNSLKKKGWDGYNAYPLEKTSSSNMHIVLNSLPSPMLTHWILFPAPNGTLTLQAKGKSIAIVNIGNTTISYSAIKKANKLIGQETFKPERIKLIFQNLNSFLTNGE